MLTGVVIGILMLGGLGVYWWHQTASLTPGSLARRAPLPALMQLRKSTVLVAAGLLLTLSLGTVYLVRAYWPNWKRPAASTTPPALPTKQAGGAAFLEKFPTEYPMVVTPETHPLPPKGVPVAHREPGLAQAAVPPPAPPPTRAEVEAMIAHAQRESLTQQQAMLDQAVNRVLAAQRSGTQTVVTPEQVTQQRTAQRQEKEAARKASTWNLIPVSGNLPGTEPKKLEGSKEAVEQQGQAAALIKPAVWARPQRPDLTIYRSQILPGRMKQAINSDIPGTVVIETTIPIYDKVNAGQIILPKDSLIIAKQTGKAEYGQSRIPLTLEQIELPGPKGVVISLKADIGDQDGARGMPANVNNHWGKLIGATLINAVLQIGLGSATGTPQGFYQSPAQRAAQDAGQAVTHDINGIVQRQLKVAPTLEVPAGAICTIALEENVTFSRQPVVVR
jgi:type IV secretory pathway VirB10-like protein